VLENNQDENGLRVPEVLRKYIPGQPEHIPWAKTTAAPAEKAEKPAKGGKADKKDIPVR
jgi:seryl-tRNA synthetase